MNSSLWSVQMKWVLALVLLGGLLALGATTRLGAVAVARALVVLLALAGGVFVLLRQRPADRTASPKLRGRLQVHARAGLSNHCGVALVEADGHSYLIAFGDGFAQIQAASGRATVAPPQDALVSRVRSATEVWS